MAPEITLTETQARDELARKREQNRLRKKRWRDKKRAAKLAQTAEPAAAVSGPLTADQDRRAQIYNADLRATPVKGANSTTTTLDKGATFTTTPLETLRRDASPAPPPPMPVGEPTDSELAEELESNHDSAEKFALLWSMFVGHAFGSFLEQTPAAAAQLEQFGLDVATAKRGGMAYVHEQAKAFSLKYGVSVSMPYESELVTVGSGALAAFWLWHNNKPKAKEPSQVVEETADGAAVATDEDIDLGALNVAE